MKYIKEWSEVEFKAWKVEHKTKTNNHWLIEPHSTYKQIKFLVTSVEHTFLLKTQKLFL